MQARAQRWPLAAPPECSVVIVNYHSEPLLPPCLRSLAAAAGPLSYEVIVVDNSGTVEASGVLAEFPDVTLLTSPGNVGFARACNAGMRVARGTRLLLLNPDTVCHPGSVAALARHLDENPGVGAVAPRLLDTDGALQYSCRRFPRPLSILFGRYALLTRLFPRNPISRDYLYLDWDHASTRPVDWVSGACVMVRRGILDRVGGLDEGFFLFVEDMDWCRRIREAGFEVVYLPEANVTHHIGVSRGPVTPRIVWERHRSMLRYARKHFGWPRPLMGLVGAGLAVRGGVTIVLDRLRRAA